MNLKSRHFKSLNLKSKFKSRSKFPNTTKWHAWMAKFGHMNLDLGD